MTYTTEYNAQLSALVASITGVDDVGRVHDRPRHGDFRERWVAEIDGITQIRAWEISPQPIEVIRREQGRRHRYRTWEITGAVSLTDSSPLDPGDSASANDINTDASFHVIQRLAGEIGDAIDTARAANVAANVWIDQDPVQYEAPQVVTIGGDALCWGITLSVTGYTIVSP